MFTTLEKFWRILLGSTGASKAALGADLILLSALDLIQIICFRDILGGLEQSVIVPAAGLVASALLSGWCLRDFNRRVLGSFTDFTHTYTEDVMTRIAHLDLLQVESLRAHDIETALDADLEQVRQFGRNFADLLRSAVTSVVCMAYVSAVSPVAAVMIYSCMAALAFGINGSGRIVGQRSRAFFEQRARFRFAAAEMVGGAREMGLHRRRGDAVWGVSDAVGADFRASEQGLYHASVRQMAVLSLGPLGLFAVIGFLVPLVVPNGGDAAPGLLAVTLFALRYINQLSRNSAALFTIGPVLDRLDELRARLPRPTAQASALRALRPKRIELRGVRFVYPDTATRAGFALGPVDLTLTPGRVLFVVGHNGSGKSTLLKVSTGLYPLAGGQILVDGLPVETTAPAYRALFSVGFAHPVVHRRLYGLDPDPAVVDALLRALELDRAVRYRAGAFDTVDLSTGQRKRLSFVTCLLEDRPVIVLDEWAADQDPRFRTLFYERLVPSLVAEGRIVVVISHDDAYFGHADAVLALSGGRVTTS